MARRDAEITADIGDDGADRPTADLCGDLLGRGQVSEIVSLTDVGSCSARRALRRSARGLGFRVKPGGAVNEPGFECVGPVQATGDAREDQRNIAGTEAARGEGEDGGGVALLDGGCELLAVVDQPADEVKEAPEAAGFVRAGRNRIGLNG